MSQEELQKFLNDNDEDLLNKLHELMEVSKSIRNYEMIDFLNRFLNGYRVLEKNKKEIDNEILEMLASNTKNKNIYQKIKTYQITKELKQQIFYIMLFKHNKQTFERKVLQKKSIWKQRQAKL